MEQYTVSTITWARKSDLRLPFYARWNQTHRLSSSFSCRRWGYPFLLLHLPSWGTLLDFSSTHPFRRSELFPDAQVLDIRERQSTENGPHGNTQSKRVPGVNSLSEISFQNNSFDYSMGMYTSGELPQLLKDIPELLRIPKHRSVITLDMSEAEMSHMADLEKLLAAFGTRVPVKPADIFLTGERTDHRSGDAVLGIVLDKTETARRSVGVVIPHYESFPFLERCITSIQQYVHPEVRTHVYIIDDDSRDGSYEQIQKRFGENPDITITQAHRTNKRVPDVGQLLDSATRQVAEEFICMIDADVVPISEHWLSYPLYLLEKHGCSSVGCDTGLANPYIRNVPGMWRNVLPAPGDAYAGWGEYGLYGNDYFTCTNNFYRVMRTADAAVVSSRAGFRRVSSVVTRFLSILLPATWFSALLRAYGRFPNADNGVQANYFMDVHRMGPKFSIPITGWVGETPSDGAYGQNVCGLIFHFALSSRVFSSQHKEVADPGTDYMKVGQAVIRNGFSEALLKDLVAQSTVVRTMQWGRDGWVMRQRKAFAQEFEEYVADAGQHAPERERERTGKLLIQ